MTGAFSPKDRADAIYAIAASWASIDGKLEDFGKERGVALDQAATGHYEGYICEAEELLKRIERRGFTFMRLVSPARPTAAAGKE